MKADDAKRLKALEKENARLKKLLAEAELDSRCSRSWLREASDRDRRRRALSPLIDRFEVSQRPPAGCSTTSTGPIAHTAGSPRSSPGFTDNSTHPHSGVDQKSASPQPRYQTRRSSHKFSARSREGPRPAWWAAPEGWAWSGA